MAEELETQVADQGLWIAGRKAVAVSPVEGGGARVRLDGGGIAVLPPGSGDIAKALALPADQPPSPVIPSQVTNAQARAALRAAGLLAAVEAVIGSSPDPSVIDAWEYSPHISRDSALVASLGAALKLSPAQIDGLFVAAAAIEF